MEHRWGRRWDTAIDATLFSRRCAVGRGRIRNLSLTGAFVQTPFAFRPLSLVDLELCLGLSHRKETHRVAGTVVRSSSDGIGIEWSDPLSPEFMRLAAVANPGPLSTLSDRSSSAGLYA